MAGPSRARPIHRHAVPSTSRTLPVSRVAAATCFVRSLQLGDCSGPQIQVGGSSLLPRSGVLRSRIFQSEMGNSASVKTEASDSAEQPAAPAPAPETKPKKKICCACPDTKKLRDDCIVQHGEDACGKYIEAHLQCLRAEGFNV